MRISPLVVFLFVVAGTAAQNKSVAVISHRGEHLHHPENTLPAFEEAVRVGADYFELDVRTTSDGKLILMHDATVDRTTNGHGEISRMTFDELRSLDASNQMRNFAGVRVPTFDEALDFARGKIKVYVDVKGVSAKDLADHIVGLGMQDDVVVYSGAISKELRGLNPRLKIMPEALNAVIARKLVEELHPTVLAFDSSDFQADVIAVARQAHAQVFVDRLGPADNPAAWQEAIDRGADGIQTDHPEELAKYLRKMSYKSQ